MNTHEYRIKKLEMFTGMGAIYKYICVICEGWAAVWDTPEERAKGYKIQPCIPSAGGTGGKVFYLATWDDVQAFEARDDVDLKIYRYGVNENAEANSTTDTG